MVLDPGIRIISELFVDVASYLQVEPRPPMGDNFEEWVFWHILASEHYRSARQGVARLDIPIETPRFERTLWQSLLEHPDLVVERKGAYVGVECKSLEASPQFVEVGTGVPCRTTTDCVKTPPRIPCMV